VRLGSKPFRFSSIRVCCSNRYRQPLDRTVYSHWGESMSHVEEWARQRAKEIITTRVGSNDPHIKRDAFDKLKIRDLQGYWKDVSDTAHAMVRELNNELGYPALEFVRGDENTFSISIIGTASTSLTRFDAVNQTLTINTSVRMLTYSCGEHNGELVFNSAASDEYFNAADFASLVLDTATDLLMDL